jgi:hypothetical protein
VAHIGRIRISQNLIAQILAISALAFISMIVLGAGRPSHAATPHASLAVERLHTIR